MKPFKPTIDNLVSDAAVVYSLPMVYERLNLAINNPRTSISDITRVLTEDQGLTTRILKLANSPMFGFHKDVDTITKAVTIIGTQQLRDLALAISVIGVFKSIPEDMINMTSFWEHSISCGIVARILATYRRETNVERFFVAGMLHDVGQLILCTRAPELIRDMIERSKESGKPHFAIQREELGFDHGDVGGGLLKRWRIPSIIAEPVTCHHAPSRANLYPIETAIIHTSDVIAQALQIGFVGETYVPAMEEHAWDRLAIPPSMLATILKQTDAQLHETMETLSRVLHHD
ncbi:MAG TPA: HDOD domain-containing protein [Nitrospirota bacterium]|nr:HDOD domain-containing protein [Nitrospirota bacterium]